MAIGTTAGAQPPYATVYIPRVKRHVTLAVPPRDVLSTLELTKAADLVLFVMSAASPVDAIGSSLVTCLYMQGVPTVAHVILGLEQLSAKRRGDRKKQLVHEAEAAFPSTRVHTLDQAGDADALVWALINQKPHHVRWLDMRPLVIAENSTLEPNADGSTGTLHVTGYVRARPLSANRLVYLPGFGAFQLTSITKAQSPTNARSEGVGSVLATPNDELQEPLDMVMPLNPLDGEQTHPTEEELQEADLDARMRRAKQHEKQKEGFVRAPKGTSAYQAAWIADDADGDMDESGDEDGDDYDAEKEAEVDSASEDGSAPGDDASHQSDGADEDELELVPTKEASALDRAKTYDDAAMAEGCVVHAHCINLPIYHDTGRKTRLSCLSCGRPRRTRGSPMRWTRRKTCRPRCASRSTGVWPASGRRRGTPRLVHVGADKRRAVM